MPSQNNVSRWVRNVASLVLWSAVSGGCAGYKLGSTLPPDMKTIWVPMFANQANYPQLETETTRATLADFQTEGTLRPTLTRSEADLALEVRLTHYSLTPLRYRRDQVVTANEYRVTLLALITLTRIRDNQVLLKEFEVKGESTFLFGGDIATAQREALPTAAKDLAHRIVKNVVEQW